MIIFKNRKTYLCGIDGLLSPTYRDWRTLAAETLVTAILTPGMRRDYRELEDEELSKMVKGDILSIEQSDFVLANTTLLKQWGPPMELVYAKQYEKYVVAFGGTQRSQPWLRYHCDVIVQSLDDAVATINLKAKESLSRSAAG